MMLTMTPAAFATDNDYTGENNQEIVLSTADDTGANADAGAESGSDTSVSLPAAVDGVITLQKDISLAANEWPIQDDVTIDLNEKTITMTDENTVNVPEGKTLTLKNGTITANSYTKGTTSVFTANKDASIVFDGITMTTTGAALFPAGNAAAVTVTNSDITAGTFVVGTNASTKDGTLIYSDNVVITLTDSTFKATAFQNRDKDTCPVMINVPGTLNITNCTITGYRQAVLVRGGAATITDSKLYLGDNGSSDVYTGSDANSYDNSNWESGNNLPMGALVVGNRNSAYKFPASCTLSGNTTIAAPSGKNAIYLYQMADSNVNRQVTLNIAGGTYGTVSFNNAENAKANISITGGTFASDVNNYCAPAYTCTQNSDNSTWTVTKADGLASTVETDKTTGAVSVTVTGAVPTQTQDNLEEDEGLSESTPTEATIVAKTDNGTATDVTVTIPASTAATMTSDSGYELTIDTDAATVVLDKNAMEAVQQAADGTAGEDITVEIKSSTGQVDNTNVSIYSVTVKAGEEEILSDGKAPENAEITITVPAPKVDDNVAETVYVWLMNQDNNSWKKVSQVGGTLTPDDEGKVTFTTPHLSDYATFTSEQTGDYDASYTDENGDVKYDTLANALTNGTTVTLLKSVNLSTTVAGNKTLVVPDGVTLTVLDMNQVAGSAGTIRVEAGGAVKVGDVEMIGGSDANINLTKGYIELSMVTDTQTPKNLNLNFVGAAAEIPADNRWTMALNVSEQLTVPMTATLDTNTTLTVNGTGTSDTEQDDGFRVANNAILTNNGKIVVNGVMTVSSAGEVTGSGTIAVNANGVLGIKTSNTSTGKLGNAVTVSGVMLYDGTTNDDNLSTVTLASGGKVYSDANITVSGNKRTLSDKTYDGTEYSYAWEYYRASSGGGGGGTSYYSITVDKSANGTVTVSPKNASKDTTVTITVDPDEGYELDSLTVTDKNGDTVKLTNKGDGKYTFNMPAGKVTVKATFEETSTEPESTVFTDMSTSAYYYDAVMWAVENGVTNGTSATTFSPDLACTRAQMVTFLWRAAGSPEPASTTNPFTDVSSNAYYYDAVMWAVENDVTNGTSKTTFSPDITVTRGQTVTFLYRNAGSPTVSGSSFSDVAADAFYADAVAWAVENDVTNGTSATAFSPNAACTRGQIVTFLYRGAL